MRKLTLILIVPLIICSCKKNSPPSCEIISPDFGETFVQGETIAISVEATDTDGSIKEVRIYIDNIGVGSVQFFPYNFDWNTDDIEEGSHTIRAVAMDDGNLEAEASSNIFIEIPHSFIDSRDGNEYEFLTIGTQTWMVENMAYLPSVYPSSRGSDSSPYRYVIAYEGSSVSSAMATDNYSDYGVLYNWEAAKIACPTGWHLPSDDEWNTLSSYLIDNGYGNDGSGADIGKSMASTSGWNSSTIPGTLGNDQATNNSSGFQALPSGLLDSSGDFSTLGIIAYFWSSTPRESGTAWNRGLGWNYDGLGRGFDYYRVGNSVRCLQ